MINNEIFNKFFEVGIIGIATGFSIGFISWGFGFAIYSIIKWFKMAQRDQAGKEQGNGYGEYFNRYEHCLR